LKSFKEKGKSEKVKVTAKEKARLEASSVGVTYIVNPTSSIP
jgi:hypothetical protein